MEEEGPSRTLKSEEVSKSDRGEKVKSEDFRFTWKLDSPEDKKDLNESKFLSSPDFSCGFTVGQPAVWCVQANLNQVVFKNRWPILNRLITTKDKWISVYLWLKNCLRGQEFGNQKFDLMFWITLIETDLENGKILTQYTKSEMQTFENYGLENPQNKNCWGWKKFFPKNRLSKLYPNTQLRFEVNLLIIKFDSRPLILHYQSQANPNTAANTTTTSKGPLNVEKVDKAKEWTKVSQDLDGPNPTISWENDENKDTSVITLQVEDRYFIIHRKILMENSKYFATLLSQPIDLENEYLKVKDVKHDVFEKIMDHFYNGTNPFLTNGFKLGENGIQLINFCSKFKVPGLMTEGVIQMISTLSTLSLLDPESVRDYQIDSFLLMAVTKKMNKHIIAYVCNYFKRNLKFIVKDRNFQARYKKKNKRCKKILAGIMFDMLDNHNN